MRRTLPLILSATALPAMAQERHDELWAGGQASVTAGKAVLGFDSTARFGEGGLYQWTQGGTIGTDIGSGIEAAIGYQHVGNYAQGRLRSTEHRLRQQMSFPLGGPFSARLRIEERFPDGGGATGWRLRGVVRMRQPFGRVTLLASHESFIELNDAAWGQQAGYRRMRNFAGIELPLARKLSAQAGYLNQYDFARSGGRDAMANVASFSVTAAF